MKSFFVTITSAKLPTYWYANRIGESFEVFGSEVSVEDGNQFFIRDEHNPLGSCILWEDCELSCNELLREILETLNDMTTDQFSRGEDKPLREKIEKLLAG